MKFLGIALLLGIVTIPPARADEAVPVWSPAQVSDASDRAYEPTAIRLVDHAERSIAMAMYLIQETRDDRHPVNRLLKDLVDAAQRGVHVELYLNTRFQGARADLKTRWLTRLRAAGGQVTALPAHRRLHDKLLIVDERYVLEGSTNWSVEALKNNWESNTLMDAPALAQQKLARLRRLGEAQAQAAVQQLPDTPLPETAALPAAWLARGGLLPRLVSAGDEREADLLLLLVRLSAWRHESAFAVPLAPIALDLGMPGSWSETALRQQVLKTLRRLQSRATGLEVAFTRGQDAWVRFPETEGPAVTVPMEVLQPARLVREPAVTTYLTLLGADAATLPLKDLQQRTGLPPALLRRAQRALAGAQAP